jgi:hypothetical protein
VQNFIKIGNIVLNPDHIVEVQDQSNGDGAGCHVWLTDGRSHGFKGPDARSVLDAMLTTRTSDGAVLMNELPLP